MFVIMIDRANRDKLALAIRQFISGRLTNDEFDEAIHEASTFDDKAINAISNEAWYMYDDTKQHKAVGKHRISGVDRTHYARCVVFLHTDLEYEWPEYSISLTDIFLNKLSFGRRFKSKNAEFERHGDILVWPFISEQDFLKANENPKYFSNT